MSLFRNNGYNDYSDYDDNNQVYLEGGYYDFDEIANWVLSNLDESYEYDESREIRNLFRDRY